MLDSGETYIVDGIGQGVEVALGSGDVSIINPDTNEVVARLQYTAKSFSFQNAKYKIVNNFSNTISIVALAKVPLL